MKKIMFSLLFATVMIHANAQTKSIAHQSHSGKASTFSMRGTDNFGVVGPHEMTPPKPIKKKTPPPAQQPKPKPTPKPLPKPSAQQTPTAPAGATPPSPNYPKNQQPKK